MDIPSTRQRSSKAPDRALPNGQAPGTPRPGLVGDKLESGEVVLTVSGRETSPFPRVANGTKRQAMGTLKRVDGWLMKNALEEARARGDEFNALQFEANLAQPAQAAKDAAEEYLFGGNRPPEAELPEGPGKGRGCSPGR